MKKLIYVLMTILGVWGCAGSASKSAQLDALVQEYKDEAGIRVLNLERSALDLLKVSAEFNDEIDDVSQAIIDGLDNLEKVTIVEIEEDISSLTLERFNEEVYAMLDKMPILLDLSEDEDVTRLYGTMEGDQVRDGVLFSEGYGMFIIRGTISKDTIKAFFESNGYEGYF